MGTATNIPVINRSTGKGRRPAMRGRRMDFAPRRRPAAQHARPNSRPPVRPAAPAAPAAPVAPVAPVVPEPIQSEVAAPEPAFEEVIVTEVTEEATFTPIEPKDTFAAAEMDEPVIPEQAEFDQAFTVVPPEGGEIIEPEPEAMTPEAELRPTHQSGSFVDYQPTSVNNPDSPFLNSINVEKRPLSGHMTPEATTPMTQETAYPQQSAAQEHEFYLQHHRAQQPLKQPGHAQQTQQTHSHEHHEKVPPYSKKKKSKAPMILLIIATSLIGVAVGVLVYFAVFQQLIK